MSITLEQIEQLLLEKETDSTIVEERNQVYVGLVTENYLNPHEQQFVTVAIEPDGDKVKISAPEAFHLEEEHLDIFVQALEEVIDPQKIEVTELTYLRSANAITFSIKSAVIEQLPLNSDTLMGFIYILHNILDEHYDVLKPVAEGHVCEPLTLVSQEMIDQVLESLGKDTDED